MKLIVLPDDRVLLAPEGEPLTPDTVESFVAGLRTEGKVMVLAEPVEIVDLRRPVSDSRIPTDATSDAIPHPPDTSVQVADEGAGGEAERSLPPPDAPIEQATPDGSPGSGSARRRQPTISPASPGTDAGAVRVDRTPADQAGERGIDTRPPLHTFDPLFPPPTTVTCPECGRDFKPQGLPPHRAKKHGVAGHGRLRPGHTNGAPAPVIRKGAERWICNRCPGASPAARTAASTRRRTHRYPMWRRSDASGGA